MSHPGEGPRIDGVLFDFHSTLVDQGSGEDWLGAAWRYTGRLDDPIATLGPEEVSGLVRTLEGLWESVREADPENRRDLDPVAHRAAYDAVVARIAAVDTELAAALYATMQSPWLAYEQAIPVLRELRAHGIRTALVSNVGVDIRAALDRAGLTELFDAVILSFEAGVVKPDAAIFAEALRLIDVPADRALMVGDSWRDDAGAAGIGIRTLILPARAGKKTDLAWVLRLAVGSD